MLPLPELDEEPELAERLGSVPPPVLSEIPGPPRDDDIASLCIHTPLSRYVFVPLKPRAEARGFLFFGTRIRCKPVWWEGNHERHMDLHQLL